MSEIAQNEFNDKTNIKVVGVGGAGGNAVNRMIAEGLQNVEFVAVNTDAKDLLRSDADVKISLSDKSSRGLGAGADPERGAKAAQDHQSDIEEALQGCRHGVRHLRRGRWHRYWRQPDRRSCGSSTGCSHHRGCYSSVQLRRPSAFRFRRIRHRQPAQGSRRADRHSERSPARAFRPFHRHHCRLFKTADTALLAGVQGITDLISMNSYIHVDFNDVNSILRGAGTALFGIGSARGELMVPRRPPKSPSALRCLRKASKAHTVR